MKTLELLKGIGILLLLALAIWFIVKIVLGLLWLLLPLAVVAVIVWFVLKAKISVKVKK
jgi:uncharacterized membrane protein